jgi:geranylgeranyl diphosphate synthase type II
MTEPLETTRPLDVPGADRPAAPNRDQVPQDKAERRRLRAAVRDYVETHRPVPPLTTGELDLHADRILVSSDADAKYRKWVAVLVSNTAWRDQVAAVPFGHRLLLLPKCLRDDDACEGTLDEFGLLCAECGRCPIMDLKNEAEALGYVVLIAEGTPPVVALLESGQIEAVVGVSCLSALESVYPLMEAAAIPGVAVPLLYDGCVNTSVDLDWVREAIHLNGDGPAPRGLNVDTIRQQVRTWFATEALDDVPGPPAGDTERIARDWLARSGKRWRPLLAVSAFKALRGDGDTPPPEDIRRLALAVECFHKASLIHDDIEDNDDTRYGRMTIHQEYGVPVALNVGDFLLGEGYRLIAASGLPADERAEMLLAAARGHRELAVGQGAELCWARRPEPLSVKAVLDIFRRKTSPAFEVALRVGAIAGGASDEVWDVLHRCSEALGIAYQIADDLKDLDSDEGPSDVGAMRPSILLAIAHEQADAADREFFDAVWRRTSDVPADAIRRRLEALGVEDEARRLLDDYETRATQSLEPLTSADLKGLLRRIVFRIFRRQV